LEERGYCQDVRPFIPLPYHLFEDSTDLRCPCRIEAFREYDPSSHIAHIAPTPLLMTVASNDCLTPTDLALKAYAKALEPKELHIIPGGHFDGYSGPNFEKNAGKQVEFLKRTLCA
jgi:fermentation-respiration switch protein FrsA (DUF1100 family)